MANDLVVYENQFNKVALRNFTSNQLNLLIAICSKMRDKEVDSLDFGFTELKELIKLEKNYTAYEFIDEIQSVNKKLLSLNFTMRENGKIIQFVLFPTFVIDEEDKSLKVSVNKDFAFLLNNLNSEFTKFELEEFVNIKSSYAKEAYRRLKQFRNTGQWFLTIDEFKRLLDIPDTYRMCDIDLKVLKPIEKELSSLFKDLIIKKISSARGRKITHIEFTFTPEDRQQKEKSTESIEKKSKYIKKPSKQKTNDKYKDIQKIVMQKRLQDLEKEK